MDDNQHSQEAMDRWMLYLERQGKSPLTREAYLNALNHFISWLRQTYSDELDPQEVIARDVREWKAHQQTVEKSSPNTINQRLVAIGRFFAWAHGENIVQNGGRVDESDWPHNSCSIPHLALISQHVGGSGAITCRLRGS